MQRRSFGEAKDYYRLRIIKITEDETPSIKWREGLNFSGYSTETLIGEPVSSRTFYNLELVELDLSKIYILSAFEKEQLAQRALEGVENDLSTLTKNVFDKKYKIGIDNVIKDDQEAVSDQDLPQENMADEDSAEMPINRFAVDDPDDQLNDQLDDQLDDHSETEPKP